MGSLTRSLLVALTLTLSGCGWWANELPDAATVCGPGVDAAPCSADAREDARYSFRLMTHCGIEWAYFDGRYWVPRVQVKTPPDWAAITNGAMTLLSEHRAVFERDSHSIVFVPAPESYRPPTCA